MRKPAIWVLLLLFCPSAAWTQPPFPPDGTLEVHFIAVGQADAILIRCPDGAHYLLIDAADTRYPKSSSQFRAYLQKHFAGRPKPWKLTTVVASHPHADHIGSMKWVFENFEVGTYVDNGQKGDTTTWANLNRVVRKRIQDGQLRYMNGRELGQAEIEFCPDPAVVAEILEPWSFASLSHTNDRSVLVRLTYNKISFLFTGDAEEHAEGVMLQEWDAALRDKLDVDVLKVGHHGSDTSSTAPFILAVRPQLAIVSSGAPRVGTNVRYKHPRYSTLTALTDWLTKSGTPASTGKVWAYDKKTSKWRQHSRREGLWLTIKDGTIVLRTDGASTRPDLEFRE